jgi:hypothetical protein
VDANLQGRVGDAADEEKIWTPAMEKEKERVKARATNGGGGGGNGRRWLSGHRAPNVKEEVRRWRMLMTMMMVVAGHDDG